MKKKDAATKPGGKGGNVRNPCKEVPSEELSKVSGGTIWKVQGPFDAQARKNTQQR